MSKPAFLYDRRFLQAIDNLSVKEEYVKITVLNWKEAPLQQIQGRVISGSVNIDGSSSMRRTAQLTLFAEEAENDLTNINSLFAINKKCKLEKGIRNTVPKQSYIIDDGTGKPEQVEIDYQKEYGQIIWFPLGIYVMFNPSLSHQMTGVNISVQLKDKMCLLNGDVGGQIHSPVVLSEYDEVVDKDGTSVEKHYVLIYDIIKEVVNHWGNEDLNKIFITEVPRQIKKTLKWMGTTPIYINVNQNQISYTKKTGANWEAFPPGRDIGFEYTDFIYPGKEPLSSNAGDTVTSILDRIIGVIGNYEYFYDVEGNFIFQEKPNNLNMSNTAYWSKEANFNPNVKALPTDNYDLDINRLSAPVYDFSDNNIITAYSNQLNYNNIKNDFVVWGSRKLPSGQAKLIRMHLAIDRRPRWNNTDGTEKQTHQYLLYRDSYGTVRGRWYRDWIVNGTIKMSEDEDESREKFYTNNLNPYTYYKIKDNNEEKFFFVEKNTNKKHSEKYVAIRQDVKDISSADSSIDWTDNSIVVVNRSSVDWREQIYCQMIEDERDGTGQNTELNNTYFQYYAELKEEFPKIYDLVTQTYKSDYYNFPDTIDYFLDMIDEDTYLGKYSVNNIGRRTLIIADNNNGINCIFEPQIPDLVYVVSSQYTEEERQALIKALRGYNQKYVFCDDAFLHATTLGGKMNSCYEKIKDLLYQYTYMNDSISITSLPVYYLEPNTRITVEDKPSGISGDFIIQSISLPLDISSTMNINAYQASKKI